MNSWRLHLLLTVFALLSFLVIFRLFYVQVIKHSYYTVLADDQHWISHDLPARRGKIFTSDGYPLVVNTASYLLYAEPPRVVDSAKTATALADFLFDINDYDSDYVDLTGPGDVKDEFIAELEKKLTLDLYWVALAHKISPQVQEAITELSLEGVGFEEEPIRSYPEGTLAAHILGFVGSDEKGEEFGYYGVEGYYNGDLRGRPGKIVEERSARGHPILVGGFRRVNPEDGADLILTIERSVQYMVEQELKKGVEQYQAKSGSVVIQVPQTGEIIAMANYPTFDPSFWWEDDNEEDEEIEEGGTQSPVLGEKQDIRKNSIISVMYEPGSVAKAFTMSAGVDTNSVEPQTTFFDAGPITVSGHLVDNWNKKHHGEETMIEVLQHSNNMGAAWVAQKLGADKLYEYFSRFGIGYLTGIDVEGEDSGWVMPPSEWREVDLVSASFGQAISTTPLQLVSAFSSIVNQGVRMRPYLVREIQDGDEAIQFKPEKVGQVMSAESSEVMVEMLTAAVEGGEAKFFINDWYKVAGKTGTAQIAKEGKYVTDKTNATFIGFLPSHPQFVVLVKLEEPSTSIYAAETAVPLWMDILEELVTFYNIPPDR